MTQTGDPVLELHSPVDAGAGAEGGSQGLRAGAKTSTHPLAESCSLLPETA